MRHFLGGEVALLQRRGGSKGLPERPPPYRALPATQDVGERYAAARSAGAHVMLFALERCKGARSGRTGQHQMNDRPYSRLNLAPEADS